MAEAICRLARVPFFPLAACAPGTHAVFAAGENIIKIYAPAGAGMGGNDFAGERFGLAFAARRGVPAPHMLACGTLHDRYDFDYLITKRVPGAPFAQWVKGRTDAEKTAFGARLRALTDRMNVPCAWPESPGAGESPRWREMSAALRQARAALQSPGADSGRPVFVHGDLCGDNLLVSPQGDITLLDFGDARLAPLSCEHAVVACELFTLDRALMRGYFGDYDAPALADALSGALLRHAYGANILLDHFPGAQRAASQNDVRALFLRAMLSPS